MISIVVAARNDDYGINFLGRFQNFINVLLPLLKDQAPQCELVVVEWNPPGDRPRLLHAVDWPAEVDEIPTRIIEVGQAEHSGIPGSDRMALFEFIAKNVGIRRAKGDYILVTNPDVLFSVELASALGAGRFSPDWFYRIDRHDTRIAGPLPAAPRQALEEARKNVFIVHALDVSIPMDEPMRDKALATGRWPGSYSQEDAAAPDRQVVPFDTAAGQYWNLHLNGAGDFLLTHRSNWERIHGYAEYTDTCTTLDSYACYQLKAAGIRQALFTGQCQLLHQDHSRVEPVARPRKGMELWLKDLDDIRAGTLGPAISGADWGLGDKPLKETVVRTTGPLSLTCPPPHSRPEEEAPAHSLQALLDQLQGRLLESKVFVEELHLQAVRMQRHSMPQDACRLYRLVRTHAGAFTEIMEWAWYKEGEILWDLGRREEARDCFRQTLRLNPGHIKARLMLHPGNEPLRVCFGERADFPPHGFQVSFPCDNLDLWRYYLGLRPADELWITPPLLLLDFQPSVLATLLGQYVAKDGEIVLAVSQEREVRFAPMELAAMLDTGDAAFNEAVMQRLNSLLV